MAMFLAPLLGGLLAAAPSQPAELGQVSWSRDFDAARAQAAESKKPLLVLFDEVPGCSTVLGFGKSVLSDPVIVAIVEAETVPVAVYNNVGGKDRVVLESFKEPTWNNPVVRIMDAELKPLGGRFSGPYDVRSFARALATALKAAGRPLPERLSQLAGLAQAAPREKATFAMYCFWEGEAQLGAIDGVTAAQAGFLDGHEAVEVEFDPGVIDRQSLVERAKRALPTLTVYARSASEADVARATGARTVVSTAALRPSAKDTKYYVLNSPFRDTELTELEALKVNAALRFGRDPRQALLAVRQ